jgi:hypothetical protein
MTDKQHIEGLQKFMLERARCLGETQANDLRCLIRIAVEFQNYLISGNPQLRAAASRLRRRLGPNVPHVPQKDLELRYVIESVFSGLDSFSNVVATYRVLVGASKSAINWRRVSVSSIKEQYVSIFHRFVDETNFEKKCRFLIDLFKLQIVFAGVMYE